MSKKKEILMLFLENYRFESSYWTFILLSFVDETYTLQQYFNNISQNTMPHTKL
uniref:Uncharacterized protein n=1 Tax=Lepeophtheirus salmonis TaxID=72036 RepID=A0A0K2SWE3_LEPSM